MKFLLLFLLLLAILLWVERSYWKRRSRLLESRIVGEEREVTSLFDAWLEGRIESTLRKKKEQN